MSIGISSNINTTYQIDKKEESANKNIVSVVHSEKNLNKITKTDKIKISEDLKKDPKSNSLTQISFAESSAKNASMVIGNAQSTIDAIKWLGTVHHTRNIAVVSKITRSISPLAHVIGSAHAFQQAERALTSKNTNRALGAITIVGSGFDITRGIKQIKQKNNYEGTYNVLNGAVGAVTGTALLGNNIKVATIAGIVGVSLPVAKYGSDSTKKLGWFKDNSGKNETVFENFMDKSKKVGTYIEQQTNNKTLGNLSTLGSSAIMLPIAVGVSVVGVVAGGTTDTINGTEKLLKNVFK